MKSRIERTPRPARRLLAAAALGLLLIGGFALLRADGEGAVAAFVPGPAAVSADVRAVLTGADGELVSSSSGYNGEGQVLKVEVPREVALAKADDPFAVADAAWRVRVLAADLAAQVPGVTGYQLRSPSVSPATLSPTVLAELTGTLPPLAATEGLRRLGSVSADSARAQLESNIAVLRKHAPAIANVALQSLELPDAGEHVAFAVGVESSDVEKLRPYLGDIFVGLQTGLVGSEDAVIDGLAITLSEGPTPVAGSWMATRALTGVALNSPKFEMPETLATTLPFVSSTDGPVPRAEATLGAASAEPQPAG